MGHAGCEICWKAEISQATYFKWKKKYAELLSTEMKRLKQLEDENSQLKKMVADLTLDREMLQGKRRGYPLRGGIGNKVMITLEPVAFNWPHSRLP